MNIVLGSVEITVFSGVKGVLERMGNQEVEAGANTFEKCWCKGAHSLVSERFKFSCIRKLLAELVLGTQLLPPPLLFTGLPYHNFTPTASAGMGNRKEPVCSGFIFCFWYQQVTVMPCETRAGTHTISHQSSA